MKQKNEILEKWRKKAEKYVQQAGRTGASKRSDKIKSDETKDIWKAYCDLGRVEDLRATLTDVAHIFHRDRRSISRAVAEQERAKLCNRLCKNAAEREQRAIVVREFHDFIEGWKTELTLPLNHLAIDNLADKREHSFLSDSLASMSIQWEEQKNGHLVRRLNIEEKQEYSSLRALMPHSHLWRPFRECKRLGGALIKKCAALIADVRRGSEESTGLKIIATGEVGLDYYFAWTIYADSLNIFAEEFNRNTYWDPHDKDATSSNCHVCWGRYTLAVVSPDDKQKVVTCHQKLRESYRASPLKKEIDELSGKLHAAEAKVLKELDTIKEAVGIW